MRKLLRFQQGGDTFAPYDLPKSWQQDLYEKTGVNIDSEPANYVEQAPPMKLKPKTKNPNQGTQSNDNKGKWKAGMLQGLINGLMDLGTQQHYRSFSINTQPVEFNLPKEVLRTTFRNTDLYKYEGTFQPVSWLPAIEGKKGKLLNGIFDTDPRGKTQQQFARMNIGNPERTTVDFVPSTDNPQREQMTLRTTIDKNHLYLGDPQEFNMYQINDYLTKRNGKPTYTLTNGYMQTHQELYNSRLLDYITKNLIQHGPVRVNEKVTMVHPYNTAFSITAQRSPSGWSFLIPDAFASNLEGNMEDLGNYWITTDYDFQNPFVEDTWDFEGDDWVNGVHPVSTGLQFNYVPSDVAIDYATSLQ